MGGCGEAGQKEGGEGVGSELTHKVGEALPSGEANMHRHVCGCAWRNLRQTQDTQAHLPTLRCVFAPQPNPDWIRGEGSELVKSRGQEAAGEVNPSTVFGGGCMLFTRHASKPPNIAVGVCPSAKPKALEDFFTRQSGACTGRAFAPCVCAGLGDASSQHSNCASTTHRPPSPKNVPPALQGYKMAPPPN